METICWDFPPYVSSILNYPFTNLNQASSLTFTLMLQLTKGTTSILYISCTSLAFSSTCFTTLSTEKPDNSFSTSLHDRFQMYSLAQRYFLIFQRIYLVYQLQLVKSTLCWGSFLVFPMTLQMAGMMEKWLSVNGKPRKSDLYQNQYLPLPLRIICSSFTDILRVPFSSTVQLQPS